MKAYYETAGDSKEVESIAMAKCQLVGRYPSAVFGDREPNGPGRDRILVWEDEAHAENDDGRKAIGQIVIAAD